MGLVIPFDELAQKLGLPKGAKIIVAGMHINQPLCLNIVISGCSVTKPEYALNNTTDSLLCSSVAFDYGVDLLKKWEENDKKN